MSHPPELIASSGALKAVCSRLAREPFVAVDTEFMSETTYKPVLCLVQVMGGSMDSVPYLIDPLAKGIDMKPLYRLLTDSKVLKVMHSGNNDTEVLMLEAGVEPSPVFDTQVAAEFCGYGAQPSYRSLVKDIAEATIDKSSQMTNWSRRPLPLEQMEYAASDVLHLPMVYRELKADLKNRQRTRWAEEETRRRYRLFGEQLDSRDAWLRLAVRSDDRVHLAVLRELAAWREEEAIKRNVPRQHVMKNPVLLRLAKMQPKRPEHLERVLGLQGNRGHRVQYRQAVVQAVARGLECPPNCRPMPIESAKISGAEAALAKVLGSVLENLAEGNGIAPRIIASTDDLRQLASESEPDIPLLKGWRRELCGQILLDLRDGRIGLKVRRGRLVPARLDDGGRAA